MRCVWNVACSQCWCEVQFKSRNRQMFVMFDCWMILMMSHLSKLKWIFWLIIPALVDSMSFIWTLRGPVCVLKYTQVNVSLLVPPRSIRCSLVYVWCVISRLSSHSTITSLWQFLLFPPGGNRQVSPQALNAPDLICWFIQRSLLRYVCLECLSPFC